MSTKIDRIFESATEIGFTKHDFADLALMAVKRSGAVAADRDQIASLLGFEQTQHDRGTRRDHIKALASICARLGGRLSIVSLTKIAEMTHRDWPDYDRYDTYEEAEAGFDLERHEGFSSPPNSEHHGLEWEKKIIYAVRGHEIVGQIIHEMGHVFASPYPPDNSKCKEWRWFGWEMAVASEIGAWHAWSRHNDSYTVHNGTDWGELGTRHQQAIAAERVHFAKKIGILSESGEPRSLR